MSFKSAKMLSCLAVTVFTAGLLGACSNPVTDRIGAATSGISQRINAGSQQSEEAPRPAVRPDNRICPRAIIRDGTQTLRSYESGGEGDPDFVRYQGSITKVARECTYSGDEILSMKFGITGRVVLGRRGAPGTFSLPIRAVLVPRGSDPAWGDLFTAQVTVQPGQTSEDFVLVEQTAAVTLAPGTNFANYILYIGFDEQAAN